MVPAGCVGAGSSLGPVGRDGSLAVGSRVRSSVSTGVRASECDQMGSGAAAIAAAAERGGHHAAPIGTSVRVRPLPSLRSANRPSMVGALLARSVT